jgi:drug/metabolite transporter (DMT)-like permease
MISSSTTAFWLLVLVNLIWGFGFVVVDDAITVMPVNVFNAFRFGVAALALMPLWFVARQKKLKRAKTQLNALTDNHNKPSLRSFLFTGFALGLFLFLGFMLQTQGLLYTSVSNTGFITGLCVPFVPLIGLLLYRIKVTSAVWGSVVLSVVGLYFLTIGDKLEFNSGDVLVALGALCYAAHISVMARVGGKFEVLALSIIQLVAVTLYSALSASFEYIAGYYQQAPDLFVQLSQANVIAAIAYSAILSSAFAFWAQTASQRLIAPHKIALIFALEPIFAHIAAVYILDETMGIKGWIGASLIIAGMLYSELGGRKKVKIQALDQTAADV